MDKQTAVMKAKLNKGTRHFSALDDVTKAVADGIFDAILEKYPKLAEERGYVKANNDEDCTEPRVCDGENKHSASHFYIRQFGTNRPVGCVALRYTGILDHFKVSVSLCAQSDLDAGKWSRKRARDAAVGKLDSPRMGFIVAAGQVASLIYILRAISHKMEMAACELDLDWPRANAMLCKQLEFLHERALEDEARWRGCP